MSTTSTAGVGSPPISLPGLGGMDFTSVIDALVQVKSIPMNQDQQQENKIKAEQSAWQQYNSLLKAFQTAADALNKTSIFKATTVSAADSNISVTSNSTAAPGTYTVTVNQTATQEVLGGGNPIGSLGTSGAISINGNTISFSDSNGLTIQDVQSAINNANAGATASIINGKLYIANNKTGDTTASDNQFTVADVNSSTLEALGINDSSGTNVVQQNGQDASITVFGQTTKSHTNTFTNLVQGINVTINKAAGNNGLPATSPDYRSFGTYDDTINVSNDTSKVQTALTNFVAAWNNINSFVKQSTQAPTQDNQNITPGILLGDYSLQSYQSMLVNAVQTVYPVTTGSSVQYNSLSSFGITYQQDGSLAIDQNQLTSALSGGHETDLQTLLTTYQSGLVSQVDNVVRNLTNPGNGLITQKLSGFATQIKDYDHQILSWKTTIDNYQKNLQIQFSQLESSLNQMNAQGSALMGMFGAGMSTSSSSGN